MPVNYENIRKEINREASFPTSVKKMLRDAFGQITDEIGDSFELVHGSGQTTGNTLTKTLAPAPAEADFNTFEEAVEYINGNVFDNVDLTITVAAGTYEIAPEDRYVLTSASGISRLTFVGADEATCILELTVNPSSATYYVLEANHIDVGFTNLTVQPSDWEEYPEFIAAINANVRVNNCTFVDLYGSVLGYNSRISFVDSTVSGVDADDVYGVEAYDNSYLYVSGCTFSLTGQVGDGIWVYHASRAYVQNTSITNAEEAFVVGGNSSVYVFTNTLTGNATDYYISQEGASSINIIHGDGSYVTDGGMTTGALDYQEYSSDGNITVVGPQVAVITKGSIAALEIAGSPADGTSLTIVAQTEFAHVVNGGDALLDGTGDGPDLEIIFDAFRGASVTLVFFNNFWHVTATNHVTLSVVV